MATLYNIIIIIIIMLGTRCIQQHDGQKLYITPSAAAWSIAGWLAGWRAGWRAKRALCCRGDDICTGGGGDI